MSERRPRLKMEPFKLALKPGDKLGCSFVPEGSDADVAEKTQLFLTALDALTTQYGYKLNCYGRLDLFLEVQAANEEEPFGDSTDSSTQPVDDLVNERDALRLERSALRSSASLSRLMEEVEKYKKKAEEAWGWSSDSDESLGAAIYRENKLKEELNQVKAQLAQTALEKEQYCEEQNSSCNKGKLDTEDLEEVEDPGTIEDFIASLEIAGDLERLNGVIDSALLILSKSYTRAGYPGGASIGDFLTWLEDFSKDLPDILSAKLNPVSASAQVAPSAKVWTAPYLMKASMSEIQKAKSVTLHALDDVKSRLHSAIVEHFKLDVHPQLIDFLAWKLYHQLVIDVLATCANVSREAPPNETLEETETEEDELWEAWIM